MTGASIRSDAGNADEKKWIQKYQKVLPDVILAINTSELYCIKHCTTSKDVWNKLKEIYESKGPAKKATLYTLRKDVLKNENMHILIFSK